MVQEGGEAGTGVDTSCGETRAAEEEPVVENWLLFDQLANGDPGTLHNERVGRIGGGEEGKDRGMLTRATERSAEWGLTTVELDVAERLWLGRSERQGLGWVHSLRR